MGHSPAFSAIFVVVLLGAAMFFYIGMNENGEEGEDEDASFHLTTRLPEERYRMAVAYDSGDGYVYLFGGRDFSVTSEANSSVSRSSIFRYSVKDGSAILLNASLPIALDGATAAWVKGRAYIIGGYQEGQVQDSIIVFTPGEGTDGTGATAEVMEVTAPVGFQGGYCASDGESTIYYTGGHSADMKFQDTVIAFTPDPVQHLEGSVTDSGMRMPSGRAGAAALWIGDSMYVFGGRNPKLIFHDVIRLDPETGDVRVFNVPMPEPRYHHCAAYDAGTDTVYIFGGRNGTALLDSVDAFRFGDADVGGGAVNYSGGDGTDVDDGGNQTGAICIPGGSCVPAGGLTEACSLTFENSMPSPGRFIQVDRTLPTPRERLAAVAVLGDGIFVFGGQETTSSTDEILLFAI